MGITDSRMQTTPSRPLRNLHLSHVTDPRSPTAGIARTPIEVGNSSRSSPLAVEEDVVEPTASSDPRSPTQGIVRTPLRQSLHASLNLLAKQLSEVFVAEDSGIEGSPAADGEGPVAIHEDQPVSEADHPFYAADDEGPVAIHEDQPASEADRPLPASDVTEPEATEEIVVLPTVQPVASVDLTPPVLQHQNPRGKSPRPAGAKKVRQRPRKNLLTSAPGRSPLKILQEDNSPSNTLHSRPVKLSFQSEQPSSLGNMKILHSSWERSHNKENDLYNHSES
ncbi:cell division cycle-associated protein 3 [Pseudophryne corroboree]|uniref:cell division cycle-associated protein 3 n=1 Tax=Pseudophryne corroboree TaxID=495146 RepID=UPI0030814403